MVDVIRDGAREMNRKLQGLQLPEEKYLKFNGKRCLFSYVRHYGQKICPSGNWSYFVVIPYELHELCEISRGRVEKFATFDRNGVLSCVKRRL